MISLRPASDRGWTWLGWLDSHHTFSFGEYSDPRHPGFRSLRVINDDRVKPGRGFGAHPHADMEILTYVLSGRLSHQDTIGEGSILQAGDLLRMSAGAGVYHSEVNPSLTDPVHFLQIWIEPGRRGLAPSYEQRHFAPGRKRGQLCLVASPDGRQGSVKVHQDVHVHAALLDGAESAGLAIAPGRAAWVHVARGALQVNGRTLRAGDGAGLAKEELVELSRGEDAEVLIFDLG